MQKIRSQYLIFLFALFSPFVFAGQYQQETLVWTHQQEWATYDKELKTFYRYLPLTEQASDQINALDRRWVWNCMVKERNLRGFFGVSSVVIGLYEIADCNAIEKNPYWNSRSPAIQ